MTSNIRRRLGYYEKNKDGTLDYIIYSPDLNETWYQELKDFLKVIFDVMPILMAFEVVKNNYEEIITSSETFKNTLKNIKVPDPEAIHLSLDTMVVLTQKIGNYLSSASSFLVNSEISLKKNFGKSSPELVHWNEYRRSLHKKSFSYRFMYELRNYAQHYELPLSGFNINMADMTESNPSIELTIYVSRDSLLKDNFDWKKLRQDVENLKANTDIAPHLSAYFDILRHLIISYLDMYEKKLLMCYEFISTFHRAFEIPEGVTPMIFAGEGTSAHPIPKNAEYIPTDYVMWVYSKYIAMKKKA